MFLISAFEDNMDVCLLSSRQTAICALFSILISHFVKQGLMKLNRHCKSLLMKLTSPDNILFI